MEKHSPLSNEAFIEKAKRIKKVFAGRRKRNNETNERIESLDRRVSKMEKSNTRYLPD